MKNLIITTALFFSLFSIAQVSETRNVSNFSKIKVANGIEVYFTQSEVNSLKVETDDNEKMKFVKTEIEGETLRIFTENNDNNKKSKKRNWNNNTMNFKILKVFVSATYVDNFSASSSGSIVFVNEINVKQLTINASSSGSIAGNIKCNDAKIELSSSADLKFSITSENINLKTSSSANAKLDGKTNSISIKSSSTSTVEGKKLMTKNAVVDANSSAEVSINVTEKLKADATSSARINYYGNPFGVDVNESSSGSISKK